MEEGRLEEGNEQERDVTRHGVARERGEEGSERRNRARKGGR